MCTDSFDSLYIHLTSTYGFPVLPAASPNPHEPKRSHAISSLQCHPTLEAMLHILNNDLPSAHFLCRHMENEPAWEGMCIHGLLHRVEGDYRNAEAWYANVKDSAVFRSAWPTSEGGVDGAKAFIQDIERLRKQRQGDMVKLEKQSKREIESLVQWCKDQFGTDRLEDGTQAWVTPSEEHRKIAGKMLTGGEGWRQF